MWVGAACRLIRINDRTALGDFDIAVTRQRECDAAALGRQVAPVLAADGARGIRRADAGARAAMLRERKNRGA